MVAETNIAYQMFHECDRKSHIATENRQKEICIRLAKLGKGWYLSGN